jgi:hypothetical protein
MGSSARLKAEIRTMIADRHRNTETAAVTPTGASAPPSWPTLIPVAIVAGGCVERPVERLMGLQCAFGKAVELAADIGRLQSPRPPARIAGVLLRLAKVLPIVAPTPSQRKM